MRRRYFVTIVSPVFLHLRQHWNLFSAVIVDCSVGLLSYFVSECVCACVVLLPGASSAGDEGNSVETGRQRRRC